MAKPSAPILQFRPAQNTSPPVDIAYARRTTAPVEQVASAPAIDLSGKPKVVFVIGRGGTGKTTVVRWMLERPNARARSAALDPVNRTLTNYAENVSQPLTSDPADAARFLREHLTFVIQHKHEASAVYDFGGGGETALASLLELMPDLSGMLEEAGMAAVALYTLGPRIDDLAPFLSLGFQPPATAFVCNMGLADPSLAHTRPFAPLLEHPALRSATEAGARVLWMPRLDSEVVAKIEQNRASFGAASRGEKGIGPFNAAQVRHWLKGMDAAFEPVSSWLV